MLFYLYNILECPVGLICYLIGDYCNSYIYKYLHHNEVKTIMWIKSVTSGKYVKFNKLTKLIFELLLAFNVNYYSLQKSYFKTEFDLNL